MTKWTVSFTIKDKGDELTAKIIKEVLRRGVQYDFYEPLQHLKITKEA